MQVKTQEAVIEVSDQMAHQVLEMARKFFSNQRNWQAFEQWHLKKYGYFPNKPDGISLIKEN